MDNGDPDDPPEIFLPPPQIQFQQRESAANWQRQDGAAETRMVSLLEEDGASVPYNINTLRNSSAPIDVAHRQDNMVRANLENSPEASSSLCVNGSHATGLEKHPYYDRESPPTQTIQPLEYRESPLQEQKACIKSANISSPKQETCPRGLEELAVSNIAHDKKRRVFRNRKQDVVLEKHRLTETERNGHAMTVGRNVDLNTFKGRLGTFRNWPKESVVPADNLAKEGFVFAGRPDRPDLVMCVKCGRTLHGWQEGDNPRNEHMKHFKENCF